MLNPREIYNLLLDTSQVDHTVTEMSPAIPHALRQTIAEGGGVRIFETGVQYCVLKLEDWS